MPLLPRSSATPSRRSTAALITAIAGLLSALAAFRRQPPEPAAKEAYLVLQKAFIEQNAELEDLRKDVLGLRKAFAEYAQAKEGSTNVSANGSASVVIKVQPSPPTASAPPTKVVTLPPPKASSTAAKGFFPPDYAVIKAKADK